MASSFFQLGYHPTNSPTLDVSGNLGISLQGFNALGRDLGKFGTTLAKTDQDNADRILAERMNQYKTEADLMNAIQSGKLYDGISGRVSAAVSQQALQDRFKMLEKDEERRKYENNLQFDKLGDYRSKIYAAAQMGNAALAGKLLQEAAIKEGATGSVVDMLKEDANPSRQALTAAGHLGLERQKYGDLRRDLEQSAMLRQVYRDFAKDANTPQKQQEAWDQTRKFAKDNGFSYIAINDTNDYVGNLVKSPGYFGLNRITEGNINTSSDFIPGIIKTDKGNLLVKDIIQAIKNEASSQRQAINTIANGLDVEKYQNTLNKYDQPNIAPMDAISSYVDSLGIKDINSKSKLTNWIANTAQENGLTIPQTIALLSNNSEFSTGINKWLPNTDPSFSLNQKQINFLKEINKDQKRSKSLIAVNRNLNKLREIENLATNAETQKNLLDQQVAEAQRLYDLNPTEANKLNLIYKIQLANQLGNQLKTYNKDYNEILNDENLKKDIDSLRGSFNKSVGNLTVEQQRLRQKQQEALNQAISY